MSRKRDLANAAWGLEFGGSAVRLVRVARTDSGYRADQFVELPLAGRWLSAPDLAAAAASLRAGKVQEPLAASMPDELTLYRALSLPAVEPAALEMMVRRQVEAFVPGAEDDLFVWGSQSGSETPSSPDRSGATDRLEAAKRRVLVCAARRDTAEKLTKSCALLGDDSAMLVPSAMALARAYREFFPLDGRCVVLLDMAARSTTAVIVHAGGVLECAVMGQGGDHWTDVIADELGVAAEQAEKIKLAYLSQGAVPQTGGEALPECIARTQALWLRQLRELYQTCVEGMPQQDRPTEGVVFGQVGRAPGLAAAVGGALGLRVEQVAKPTGLSLAEGVGFERAAAAIGLALCQLDRDQAAIDLAVRPRREAPCLRRITWRWAAVVGWVLAAIIALYALDRYEAGWLKRAAEGIRSGASSHGGLDRQLNIGSYLEKSGPHPLAILEEISALAPKQTILTGWNYSRGGQVSIAGTASSEKDFHAFLKKLRESRMLSDIEPRGHKKESDKFRFELAFKAGPAGAAVRPAATTKPAATTQPKAATQASQPATATARPATTSSAAAPAGPGADQ